MKKCLWNEFFTLGHIMKEAFDYRDLIKCTTCDALFYNKRAYDNHNMYHRPDDLYVTSEEQR